MNMPEKCKVRRKFSNAIHPIKIALLIFGVLLTLSGCERATTLVPPGDTTAPDADEPLTVMTYNLYVGGDTGAILAVENPLQVPTAVQDMYNSVIAVDFPGRAAAIAKSVKAYQPHLIGLQEVSLIRQQTPGDLLSGGTDLAEDVVLDFLEILMAAFQAEGLDYQVAAKVQNVDVEMPMFTNAGGNIDDARLTDYGVILARSDVAISRPVSVHYEDVLVVESLGFQVDRGYTAVDATIAGVTYRFVNTHLEAFSPEHRLAQAEELIASLQSETLPIILLGDFNSHAPAGATYQRLLEEGYVDTWQPDSEGTGYTGWQAPDLRNETSILDARIDIIFVRDLSLSAQTRTATIGDTPEERLASGLWPSDHAGVVAQLEFE